MNDRNDHDRGDAAMLIVRELKLLRIELAKLSNSLEGVRCVLGDTDACPPDDEDEIRKLT